MSTQEKPDLWKGYVLKAVVAALVVFAGCKDFVDKPSLEQPAGRQRKGRVRPGVGAQGYGAAR